MTGFNYCIRLLMDKQTANIAFRSALRQHIGNAVVDRCVDSKQGEQ